MHFTLPTLLPFLLALTVTPPSTLAKDCNTVNPWAAECVQVYGGTGCQDYNLETSYVPTCEGNCYVYGFDSLQITPGEFDNVDCHAYSDANCQNEIGNTGNVNGGCYNYDGGQSMKCYYDC